MDRLAQFDVEDADIVRIVLDFLYRRQSYEALSGLLLESNLSLPFLVPEGVHISPSVYDAPWLLYLQKLVLQGRWDDLDGYLKSIMTAFKSSEEIAIASKIQVEILRQKFLEVLSWQGGGGQKIAFPPWQWQLLQTSRAATEKTDVVLEMLLSYLNQLQTLCSEEDFGALCQCLTLDRLDEHPLFADWTVSQGRIACFREIRSALLGYSESPSRWAEAGSETGLEVMASLALHQLQHRRETGTPSDPQRPTKAEFDPRSRCLVPLTHTNIAPDHAIGVLGANINVLNKISFYRRFDQKSPFEKPAVIPARIPLVTPPAQSHVFDFISHRDGQNDSGDEWKAGVAETKREDDDAYAGEPNQIIGVHVAPTTDSKELPQQGIVKAPRRPPPIPATATSAGVNAVPEISNTEVTELERQRHGHLGNDLSARGGESLVEKVKDSGREAVAFFVDVGPPAGKPRNTNSRFAAAAGKERSNKDAKEDQPAVEVESSEQRIAGDKSKALKHDTDMDAVHKNENIPSMLPHKKTNIVAEESFINSPQPRIRESPLLPPNHKLEQHRNEGGRLDAAKPQTKAQHLPNKQTTFSPTVLFRTDCPLRCVCLLSSQQEYESGSRNYGFAVGSNSKCVQTFSVSEEDLCTALPTNDSFVQSAVDVVVREKEFLNIHKGSVYALDWLGSHQLLVSGSNDKCLKICNVQSGLVSGNYKGHNGTIRVVKFNNWGGSGAAEIASAGAGDCKPRIWDINDGKNVATLSAHPDAVHGLFWRDSSTVVTGCDSGLLCVHDVRNPHAATKPAWSHQLQRGSEVPSVCCLAPLGQDLIVVGCSAGWLQIVDTRNGRSVVEQRLHTDDIRSLSILPLAKGKGWGLLTSSYDSTAALWSLDSSLCSHRREYTASDPACEKVLTLSRGHSDKVLCAAFAVGAGAEVDWARPPPILSSGADGVVLLWQATSQGRVG